MQTFFSKQTYLLLVILTCNFLPSCGLFRKDPTSVEQAEKLISKDRQRRKNKAAKVRKATIKSHWNRQSKAAKRTMKRSAKEKKKTKKIQNYNAKYRKKHYS